MGWFTKFFEKDDWRLVGIMELPIVRTGRLQDRETGTLYYYLHESKFGKRKFDVADTFRGDLELDEVRDGDIIYRSEEYLTRVKPWMSGRKITGITTYEKAPMHDFKNQLTNGE